MKQTQGFSSELLSERPSPARVKLEELELAQTSNHNIYKETGKTEGEPRYFTKAQDEFRFYKEYRVLWGGKEYRYWNPHRSKWGIHITRKELRDLLKPDVSILYLGAATGSSISHLSEVIPEGTIYAVEFSPSSFRRLRFLGKKREQVFPLLFDASKPESYQDLVPPVDFLYMDISQANQVEIFQKNVERFLKEKGTGLFVLKERSISVSKEPSDIQKAVEKQMDEANMDILQKYELLPYDKDHMCYLMGESDIREELIGCERVLGEG